MALAISMLCVSCVGIVLFMSLNLNVKIKKFKIHLYWTIPFICAVVLLVTKAVPIEQFGGQLISDTSMNPLKVLALFISMSAMSIYLDQAGLFRYLAASALRHAGTSQKRLFFLLYAVVALLTVATSNATVILTFTPFICYFAKNSGINPVPFLFMEYVAANTWSMFLLIGNATNTYIATAFNITFVDYIKVMAVPTVFAAITSLFMLYLMFRKQLKQPLEIAQIDVTIKNKPALIVGVTGLLVCTLLLIISSYIGLEMWLISLVSAVCVMTIGSICYLAKKQGMRKINKTLRRMPWHLVPFLLSMYVVVLGLKNAGVIEEIARLFDNPQPLLCFGGFSAIAANFMSNIPMSILFTDVLKAMGGMLTAGVFAVIIGSNMGNLFTPVSAMNAIMWRSVIKHKHVKFGFGEFLRRGFIVGVPTFFAACGGLALMLTVL